MAFGPYVIPMEPGGVPVIIHLSQNEGVPENFGDSHYDGKWHMKPRVYDMLFYLLEANNTYYKFVPYIDGSDIDGAGEAMRPADFHFIRPDGKEFNWNMQLSRDLYITNNQDGNKIYVPAHELYLRDVGNELTEISGDVYCEIIVYKYSKPDNGERRTANFIVRVEPSVKEMRGNNIVLPGSGSSSGSGGGGTGGSGESEADFLSWLITI